MAALIYRGKGLIATVRAQKFLALYPYSGAVVAANLDVLENFETTSGSIHYRTPPCGASSRHAAQKLTPKSALKPPWRPASMVRGAQAGSECPPPHPRRHP
jgi:hypothetical protein